VSPYSSLFGLLAAKLLVSRPAALFDEPPLLAGERGASSLSLFWRDRDTGEHGAELFQAIGAVPRLVAESLARENHLAFARQPIGVLSHKPPPHSVGQAGAAGDRPP